VVIKSNLHDFKFELFFIKPQQHPKIKKGMAPVKAEIA
jgi:hypothetical protein